MQDSLATENTEGNFCSSRRENFSIPTDEVSSQLQETATLPSTKESTKDDLTPKHTVSQHLEKNKGEVPSPIATGPFRETRGTTMPSGRFKKVCEGVFRILTPIAILGICSLPIALYFTVPRSFNESSMSSSVPVNCTKKSKGDDGTITSNCSLFVWGEIIPTNSDASCSAERYTGSVCRQQLLAWQECAIGGAEGVFLDRMITELSQPQREKQAYQFLQLLQSVGSDSCQRLAGLLVCQSYFPLCDECESGRSYLASREECERVSMVECAEEWTSARKYGIPLPNCTDLPAGMTSTDYSAVVGSDELPSLNVSNLTCREDFFEKNFTCLPRCDSWDDRPPSPLAMFEIIVRLAGGILDLFLNAWFLIIFTARRKALFVFPKVFLLYNGIGRFLITSLEVIGILGNTRLYCSSADAIETVASPTLYCTFQGAAYSGLLSFNILCWHLHIGFIFYRIVFPVLAMRSKPCFKWFHLCSVIFAASVAIIVVIIDVTAEETRFTILSFPPLFCTTKGTSFYGSILLPTVTFFIAISMLATTGWVIHKRKAYTAEVKISIVFVYYFSYVLVIICQQAVRVAWRESYINATNGFFLCEAIGHVPGKCSRETFEQYSRPFSVFNYVYHIMSVFVPIVNLVFVINCRALRGRVRRLSVFKFWTKSSQ